jgi:hypothetical protein
MIGAEAPYFASALSAAALSVASHEHTGSTLQK